MRPTSAFLYFSLAAALLCSTVSCTGSRPESAAPLPGLAGLPLPDAAARLASEAMPGLTRLGSEFHSELANLLVSADGDSALFSPEWNPPAAGGLSAAIYSFTMSESENPSQLQLDWAAAPAAEDLWLALADWEAGRWQWYTMEESSLKELSFADYAEEGSGAIYVVVCLLGTAPATLTGLQLLDPSAPPAEWSHSFGSASRESLQQISVDSTGNLYACGFIESDDEEILLDTFVCKYSASGELLWARRWHCNSSDVGSSIAVAADDSVWVAGSNGVPGHPNGSGDGFVLHYSPQGELLDQLIYDRVEDDFLTAIARHPDGNMRVAGFTDTVEPEANRSIVLLSISPEGAIVAQTGYDSVYIDQAYGVNCSSEGDVFIAGLIDPENAGAKRDALMLRFDENNALTGQLAWGGTNAAEPILEADILLDALAGADGSSTFGGSSESVPAGNFRDTLLISLDASFSPLYAKLWSTTDSEYGKGLCLGPEGQIFQTGEVTTSGGMRILLLSLQTNGTLLSASHLSSGGFGNHYAGGVTAHLGDLVIGASTPAILGPVWNEASGNLVDGEPGYFFPPPGGTAISPGGELSEAAGSSSEFAGTQDIDENFVNGIEASLFRFAPSTEP